MRVLVERPFHSAALSLAVCAALSVSLFDPGVEAWRAFARTTGRAGLLWFLFVFAIGPWHRFAPHRFAPEDFVRAARKARRRLGLAFGLHHFVHLGALLVYLRASGQDVNPGRAAGGVAAYAVLALMMATSNDAAVRSLGATNWSRLHRAGQWYLWIVFVLAFVPKALGQVADAVTTPIEASAALVLLAAAAALRFSAWRRTRV
jgi:sulfoxide reductase heme-binding subunit YedZ